jgi:acetolactate synthase I/III small subunit
MTNGNDSERGQERTCVLSMLVQNQPGVLSHIAGMFAARGYNIDSLVVGRTEDAQFSRMVLVTSGNELTLEQIRKQLGKIVAVVKVRDLTEQDYIERDLLLIKVHCLPEHRADLKNIADIFRANIVDLGPNAAIIQLTGTEQKVEAFIELCRPYGIQQAARTGLIAVQRASQPENRPPRPRPHRHRSAALPIPEGFEDLGLQPLPAPLPATGPEAALPPS